MVVRLDDEEVSIGGNGLGTGLRGMVSSSVTLMCFCCDGGSDRGDASARKSRGGGKDGALGVSAGLLKRLLLAGAW